MSPAIELFAVPGLPVIEPGDDLALLIAERLDRPLQSGDVVVIAQKIVSKAENRFVDLATVKPSPEAERLAAETGKAAAVVEVVLSESVRVVRSRPNLMIMQHRLGMVMANAGVDHSNVAETGAPDRLLLLPRDPDASAERLRTDLSSRLGVEIAVVISDSFGRAWRRGTVGVAIGAAGLPALVDLRGTPDMFGRTLEVTVIGFADEIAAAAGLVMGQADERQPVVVIRGLRWAMPAASARELIRPPAEDLFQ
ncbi:MAG: coenzyme F420-0:L-glutamate ligase [Alphaproteobacteria bacterium]|nr:coenzyme F420-0:L-glutamate ligase [Alphaproteobacteria bacterium]